MFVKKFFACCCLLIGGFSGDVQSQSFDLQKAVDYALNNNPDLQIMKDRIGQAEAGLGEAMASFYPHITTRLSYEHSDNPSRTFGMIISQRRLDLAGADFNHPDGTDNYRPEIVASYSLYRGGQDSGRVNAAERTVEAVQQDEVAARNRLVQAVSGTFYAHLAAVEQHKVTQRSISAVSSELRQSRARYDAGSELKSDVLSLQVQLAEATDAEIKAANAIELTRTGLRTLLGLEAGQPLEISPGVASDPPPPPAAFAELYERALAERAEIKAASKRLEAAQNQLSAAEGAFLPRADAYVSYGSDSPDLDFSTDRDNLTAGVSVELDLFTGFRTQEKVNQAEYQLSMAEKSVRQVRLQIENEVKSAHLKLIEALARLEVMAASVNAAEEALRMVNEQRKAGVVTVTRYIDAEVARDKAHSLRIAAQFDALRAETQLKQAIGFWK